MLGAILGYGSTMYITIPYEPEPLKDKEKQKKEEYRKQLAKHKATCLKNRKARKAKSKSN